MYEASTEPVVEHINPDLKSLDERRIENLIILPSSFTSIIQRPEQFLDENISVNVSAPLSVLEIFLQ